MSENRLRRLWNHPYRSMYLWFGFLGLVLTSYIGLLIYVLVVRP